MQGRRVLGEPMRGLGESRHKRQGLTGAQAGAAKAWWSTDDCLAKLFFKVGRPAGFAPRRKRMSAIFVSRADPNESNQTDSDRKMGRPVEDALNIP
jgi:hypothetical protein